jgi:hypothetical protein
MSSNLELFDCQTFISFLELATLRARKVLVKLQLGDLQPIKICDFDSQNGRTEIRLNRGIRYLARLECFSAFQICPVYIYFKTPEQQVLGACGFDLSQMIVDAYRQSSKESAKFVTYQVALAIQTPFDQEIGNAYLEFSVRHFPSKLDHVYCFEELQYADTSPAKSETPVEEPVEEIHDTHAHAQSSTRRRKLPRVYPRLADLLLLNRKYLKARKTLAHEVEALEQEVRIMEAAKRKQEMKRRQQKRRKLETGEILPRKLSSASEESIREESDSLMRVYKAEDASEHRRSVDSTFTPTTSVMSGKSKPKPKERRSKRQAELDQEAFLKRQENAAELRKQNQKKREEELYRKPVDHTSVPKKKPPKPVVKQPVKEKPEKVEEEQKQEEISEKLVSSDDLRSEEESVVVPSSRVDLSVTEGASKEEENAPVQDQSHVSSFKEDFGTDIGESSSKVEVASEKVTDITQIETETATEPEPEPSGVSRQEESSVSRPPDEMESRDKTMSELESSKKVTSELEQVTIDEDAVVQASSQVPESRDLDGFSGFESTTTAKEESTGLGKEQIESATSANGAVIEDSGMADNTGAEVSDLSSGLQRMLDSVGTFGDIDGLNLSDIPGEGSKQPVAKEEEVKRPTAKQMPMAGTMPPARLENIVKSVHSQDPSGVGAATTGGSGDSILSIMSDG